MCTEVQYSMINTSDRLGIIASIRFSKSGPMFSNSQGNHAVQCWGASTTAGTVRSLRSLRDLHSSLLPDEKHF